MIVLNANHTPSRNIGQVGIRGQPGKSIDKVSGTWYSNNVSGIPQHLPLNIWELGWGFKKSIFHPRWVLLTKIPVSSIMENVPKNWDGCEP